MNAISHIVGDDIGKCVALTILDSRTLDFQLRF